MASVSQCLAEYGLSRGNAVLDRYAGDVSVQEAWRMLEENPQAMLVDVRTEAEWAFVGLPAGLPHGGRVVTVSWQHYPDMVPDPAFVDALRAAGAGPGRPVLFLCRSGARSRAAAVTATAEGLGPCYNVAGGFEGDRDGEGHRGRLNGWKAAGLPWVQS